MVLNGHCIRLNKSNRLGSKVKVLHVLNELKPSGAETMLCIAAPAFAAKGVNAEVLSTGSKIGAYAPQFELAGYKLNHIPFAHSPIFFFKLYRLFRNGNYDVIHLHTERANFWIGLVAIFARPKRVLRTIHSSFGFSGFLRYRRMVQRRLLNILGVAHVSIGTSVLNNELATFGLKTRRVSNWYDDTRFIPASALLREQVRIEFAIPNNKTVIVTVGNCSKVKNHEALLHALAQLPVNARPIYLHVGNEEAGQPERQLAIDLGIEDTVRFLGPLTDIRPALMAADIFVMPSLYEGFGIAAIEALAMGLPAVFTDVPGLRDFQQDFHGIVYAQPDVNSLLNAIVILLAESNEKRRLRSKNYPEISRGLYGVMNGVQGYFDIYSGH